MPDTVLSDEVVIIESAYNAWIGRMVENTRTGHRFLVRDIISGCLWLSGGQLIPLGAVAGFWRLVGGER